MNNEEWKLSNIVSQLWRQRLAAACIGCVILFVLVNVVTAKRLPADSFIIPYLRAFLLSAPLWILSIATRWRSKMTWWSWGLHAVALLLDAILLVVISGIRPRGGNQADLGAGLAILELHIFGIGLTVLAILLGFGVDWLIHRYSKNSNSA
jgi:hypothetical protein